MKWFNCDIKKLACVMVFTLVQLFATAQPPLKQYRVKDGKMYIMLSKKISPASLDSFIIDFNLEDLNLKKVVLENMPDSLPNTGWKIEIDNNELMAFSKKLVSIDNIKEPSFNISIEGRSSINNYSDLTATFGVNKFKNKSLFAINDSIVTFYLRNNTDAKKVVLAGSFNNWSPTALEMKPTSDGWTAEVKLAPGKYQYKFVIDGHWDIDRDNKLVENDGKGNDNSVFYKPNYIFRSHQFLNSKELFVAGSFNNWNEKEVPMAKTNNGWAAAVYIADGTYRYRYIADGKWSEDTENKDRFPNEFGQYNSVVRLGKSYLIKLDSFTNASKVELLGSFNNWREGELFMTKVNDGWELPYTFGDGNYEYTFKIDGKWVSGAANNILTTEANKANYYSLILKPNYTFRLKGYADAKDVFISGDFNNWSPNTYRMTRQGNEWVISMHIDKGKHTYKFVVDGNWMLDPANKLWEQNDQRTGNSILWIEE